MKKNYYFLIMLLFVATIAVAQNSIPAKKVSFNGNHCDELVAKLVDPMNFQSVNLLGISSAEMTKSSPDMPTGMDITLKENAILMDLAAFFDYYKVPAENKEMIKVNGTPLKIRENFLASKTMIARVDFGKENTGKLYTNIITAPNKK